jgi:SAM-dependent methyltransferase
MHPSAFQIIPLYERHAAAFDRLRQKGGVEKAWLEQFCAIVGAGATVLDLGCGSGEPIARYLIEGGHAVTGVDSSAAMVAMCRQRFPGHVWTEGDMRLVQLDQKFGGIVAWDSFFHLPAADQRKMFGVFADHARPGAALLFTSGSRAGESIGEFEGEPLYHASLDAAEYRALLHAHGFEVLAYVEADPECGHRTVTLARKNQ